MKKELSIFTEKFELNFFYPTELVGEEEVKLYEQSLKVLSSAFLWFLESDLSLTNEHFILSLNLIDDNEMIEINEEYRNKKKTTDVLSFPLQENLRNLEYDTFIPEVELGDLFVCKSICEQQALEFKLTYIEEFLHLATHGFLHLCGYDHEISEPEEKLMEGLEAKILEKVSILRGKF